MSIDTTCTGETEAQAAAWERVYRAHAPLSAFEVEWWKLAREGHRNRLVMLGQDLDRVSGCVYGGDGPCANRGEPCEHADCDDDHCGWGDDRPCVGLTAPQPRCPYDTPERAEKREALRALLALLRGAS